MKRLERIQRISAVFRYLLITAATVIGVALIVALFTSGQTWVSIADGRFAELWSNGADSRLKLVAVTAPIVISVVLGVYWLQRLFGEYQQGRFFSDGTMRCYVWLVWLKAIYFLYSAVWPALLVKLSAESSPVDLAITIDVGTLVELLVLLLIVHLLKEAQRMDEENKAFV